LTIAFAQNSTSAASAGSGMTSCSSCGDTLMGDNRNCKKFVTDNCKQKFPNADPKDLYCLTQAQTFKAVKFIALKKGCITKDALAQSLPGATITMGTCGTTGNEYLMTHFCTCQTDNCNAGTVDEIMPDLASSAAAPAAAPVTNTNCYQTCKDQFEAAIGSSGLHITDNNRQYNLTWIQAYCKAKGPFVACTSKCPPPPNKWTPTYSYLQKYTAICSTEFQNSIPCFNSNSNQTGDNGTCSYCQVTPQPIPTAAYNATATFERSCNTQECTLNCVEPLLQTACGNDAVKALKLFFNDTISIMLDSFSSQTQVVPAACQRTISSVGS